MLTVAQVFELADLLGRRSFGNIRKVIGGYRLRYARNGQMRAHPEVFATRPAAEWAPEANSCGVFAGMTPLRGAWAVDGFQSRWVVSAVGRGAAAAARLYR